MSPYGMALCLIMLAGCTDPCGNSVVTRLEAPGGGASAFLFQRDCGATTSFSTQVSVLKRDEALKGGGNTFRADDNRGLAADGEWGGPWVEIAWKSPNELVVRYAAKSRVFKKATSVNGVSVRFEQQAR